MTKVYKPEPEQSMIELDQIVKTLDHGGTIIYPTDTIWGIGCDATNRKAVEKVYQLKERPRSKPFIILVDGLDMLHNYVVSIHPRLETLLFYHRRPLTVIYEKPKNLPDIVLGRDGTAGIRITVDPFCQEIISALGRPVIATSANKNSEPFPTSFGNISFDVLQKVDYIVNYKRDEPCEHDPSAIVKLSDKSELIFLRD